VEEGKKGRGGRREEENGSEEWWYLSLSRTERRLGEGSKKFRLSFS